ncbi:hypothetical protein J5U46_06625 [Micromonospora tulbaghiae]|uniref:Uncharacterized protein n=1 Tax=Micromonospora tulbaghiae TaxID=479978 RepID=A0AAW4JEM5_9ACTN|nr:hypothetical protein F8279_18550 [Micromonospora sp. AMSO1212t]MBO4139819.1 hypothetical protein [Micromonospora tulbaghiae]
MARGTLRLGLLLGAVAVVWGAHEAASGSAAHAAEREPSGPLTATVGVLTHTLGTVLGLPVSGTDDGDAAPSGPGDAAASPGRPHTPPVVEAVVTPVQDRVLTPVTDGLRPVTDPLRDHLLAPVADGLRPVTDPVTVGVLDPVADLLSPVVEPLRPILGPAWRGLEPVLDPLSPVTDLLDPPATPDPGSPAPGEPVPEPSDPVVPVVPADPAATPAPAPGRAHDAPPRAAGPVLAAPAARTLTAVGTRWVDPVRSRAPAAVGPAAHVTTRPALPLPLDGVTHGGGAVHSEPADADANRWRLPALTHGYARPAADPLPPSRTSRPGTRPA